MSHDPKLERMIQEGLKAPEPAHDQTQLAQGDIWMRAGNCPQCGAPIWAMLNVPAEATIPRASYSCPCAMLVSVHARRELQRIQEKETKQNGQDPK